MPIQRLLTGALLCALLPAMSVDAKEQRGLRPEDGEVAKALPVRVVVLQPRLGPQIRYNYIATADAGINAGNNLFYNPGGMSYGQAMGMGLAGGLIAGAIINGAEKAAAKRAVRDPYQVISQARCDLPLVDSHQAMVASALQHAGWPAATGNVGAATGKDIPRYVFTMSTSFAPDFSALMTTIDAAAYVPDAAGKTSRNATWQDSLVVVSDGLWLPAKTQSDIERMVAAEKERYDASGADELIDKANKAGANASRKERQRALLVVSRHAENMADAKSEGWSNTGTAMRRAMLWSENDCALLEKTLKSNLEHADGMIQALLRHSLPTPGGASPLQPLPAQGVQIASTRTNPDVIAETEVSVGVPEGTSEAEPSAAPTRVIEAVPGGIYVSRLSMENITLGYRHMVLDD
ncbi:MAG: hypothetical protein ACREO7_02765 [Pseudoxanthomonas sp.]